MAARTRKTELDQQWRNRIRTSMLLNRLSDHVVSEEDLLTTSQVRAAEILLRKTMPDLSQVRGEVEVAGSIEVIHKIG